MTHGLPGLVPADKEGVVVGIRVANDGDRTVRIRPSDFALVVAGVDSAPLGGTLSSTLLAPGASLEGRLTFVLPRASTYATLRYSERKGSTTLLDLGLIPMSPAPSGDPQHAH